MRNRDIAGQLRNRARILVSDAAQRRISFGPKATSGRKNGDILNYRPVLRRSMPPRKGKVECPLLLCPANAAEFHVARLQDVKARYSLTGEFGWPAGPAGLKPKE